MMKAGFMAGFGRSVRNGIVAAILFVVSTSCWLSAGEAPAFIQVGKTYSVIFGMEYQFTVLEIGKDGWIRVSLRQRNQVAWINTSAIPVISPSSP